MCVCVYVFMCVRVCVGVFSDLSSAPPPLPRLPPVLEQMQNVARHTTALVKKQEQLGATMFDFGMAFTMLANVSERTVNRAAVQHLEEVTA